MASTQEQPGTSDALEGGATVVWQGDLNHGEGNLRFGLWGTRVGLPLALWRERLTAAEHASLIVVGSRPVSRRHGARRPRKRGRYLATSCDRLEHALHPEGLKVAMESE